METNLDEQVKKMQDETIATFSKTEKLIIYGILIQRYDFFNKSSDEIPEVLWAQIDERLRDHMISNGTHGLKMTLRVGKAMKSSIENPVKREKTFANAFKNSIKRMFS